MQPSLCISPRIIERYANALFDLALQSDLVTAVAENFVSFETFLRGAPMLVKTMENPVFPSLEQSFSIRKIAEKLGMLPIFQNFLAVLVKNRRFDAFESIMRVYERRLFELKGGLFVCVISARTLEDSFCDEVKGILEKHFEKNVSIVCKLDKSLLDGFVLEVGSYRIDLSLKMKLESLELILKEVHA